MMKASLKQAGSNPRQITPHKGGRSVKVSADVTPVTKKRIDGLKKLWGVSLADLIEWASGNYQPNVDFRHDPNT